MSRQKNLVAMIKALSGQANILAIPRVYLDLVDGDIDAALFLSQCIYWGDKTDNPHGFYKSADDWKDEIGFGHSRLARCMKSTSKWVSYSNHRANGEHTRHFKVNYDQLAQDLTKLLNPEVTEPATSEIPEMTKLVTSETTKLVSCLTETTQEITKEFPSVTSAERKASTRDIQDAYQKSCGYPINWRNGNAGAAKWLSENGYSAAEVTACYAAMKAQPFWKDKAVHLQSLIKQIGELSRGGAVTVTKTKDGGFYA